MLDWQPITPKYVAAQYDGTNADDIKALLGEPDAVVDENGTIHTSMSGDVLVNSWYINSAIVGGITAEDVFTQWYNLT